MMDEAISCLESYNQRVIDQFKYRVFDFSRYNFSFAGVESDALTARYRCHHRAEQYLRSDPDRRIVTTGVGMSAPPRMTTVSHLLKMVELQQGGERCQIVLGDLDAYNGKMPTNAQVTELAHMYGLFTLLLGFQSDSGKLRRQIGHLSVLEVMYLTGRYVDQLDFDVADEDNHNHSPVVQVRKISTRPCHSAEPFP